MRAAIAIDCDYEVVQSWTRPADTRVVKAPAQGLTEYGMLLAFVTFVASVGLGVFGGALGDRLTSLLSSLSTSV